jgi:hypothetical protein
VYPRPGQDSPPLGVRWFSEGLGGTGVAAMPACKMKPLLCLLELHNVALGVPPVEDDVATEVPGT